jgi:hypothetical protein
MMKFQTTALILAALFVISCNTSSPTSGNGGSNSSKSCVISGMVDSQSCSSVSGSTSGLTQSHCAELENIYAEGRAAYSGSGITYTCRATWQ